VSTSQLIVCGICKQNIESESKENSLINCIECDAPYHRNHLKIWLQIEQDCPVCRKDLQKLAFVNFSIKYDQIEVSGELYNQLEEIFPRGIPKPIFEKYIQEYPNGIPQDEFTKIKDKHQGKKLKRRSINRLLPNTGGKKYQKVELTILDKIIIAFFILLFGTFAALVMWVMISIEPPPG
jgi:hypothetical protein